MFFLLSKLFWAAVQPSGVAVLLLVTGLLASWRGRTLGWRLLSFGAVLLLLLGFSPAANVLVYPLEERFAGFIVSRMDIDYASWTGA